MRKYTIIILILLFFEALSAQETSINNKYKYLGLNTLDQFSVLLIHQQSWIGFKQHPSNSSLGVYVPMGEKWAFNVNINYAKVKSLNELVFDFGPSFHLPLGSTKLIMGVNVGYFSKKFHSNVNILDKSDPSFYPYQKRGIITGFHLGHTSDYHYFMINNTGLISYDTETKYPGTFNAIIGGIIPFNEDWKLDINVEWQEFQELELNTLGFGIGLIFKPLIRLDVKYSINGDIRTSLELQANKNFGFVIAYNYNIEIQGKDFFTGGLQVILNRKPLNR